MSPVLALVAALFAPAAMACPSVEFVFVGQPDCVELSFTGQSTRLVSRCEAPLLVDQSVLPEGLILPGTTTEIRDLSAFTIGLEGVLYRAVAMMEEPAACAGNPEDSAVDTATDTGL
jgi:hypothetical protein